MGRYTCIAALEDGRTRCRKAAKEDSMFCEQSGHQEGATITPAPDVILLKPKVNPHWFGMLADEIALIPQENRIVETRIQEHIEQAEALGRKPFALRDPKADSGSPVFGEGGAEFVSLANLIQELLEERYLLTGIHSRKARNQPMMVLTLVFSRRLEDIDPSIVKLMESDLAQAILGVILGSVWQYCHVWANPPDKEGKVVNTINLAHRWRPEKVSSRRLRFANGLWELE